MKSGVLKGWGYGASGGALAILFLFPLLWSGWASLRTGSGFRAIGIPDCIADGRATAAAAAKYISSRR